MLDVLMTLDLRHALLLGHVLALVMGFGVAMSIDFLLLRSLLSNRTSPVVLDFAQQASKLVSVGLLMLWLTGFGFLLYYYFNSPEKLLNSKIYAKVMIVSVLTINGWAIHRFVFPVLWKYSGRHVLACASQNEVLLFAATGAVSVVSWCFPIIFGLNPALNFDYSVAHLLGQYFLVLGIAIALACVLALKARQNGRAVSLVSYHTGGSAHLR